jgi:hypothetical protein
MRSVVLSIVAMADGAGVYGPREDVVNGAFGLAAHGAAFGVFPLIFGLLWRDRRGSVRGWLAMALMAGGAAAAVVSVPEVQQLRAAWLVPLWGLVGGVPALFWIWAMAAFDDAFVPRRWHALPWIVLVLARLASHGRFDGAETLGMLASLLGLALTVLAAVQTVATWRADLVAGRRRLRVAVLVGTVAYIVVDTAMGLIPSLEMAWSNGGQTIGLFALGLMAAWNSLRVAWEAPVRVAALPVGPASEAVPPPADPALLKRLEQMMTTERIYRQDGLTIGGLAVLLRVPEYRLRQAINEGLGCNRGRIAGIQLGAAAMTRSASGGMG